VPNEVPDEVTTNFPDTTPVWVDGREYIELVLNVHIL
jgi:hypothetical protein